MKINFIIPPVLDGTREAERIAGCSYSLYHTPNIIILLTAAVLRESGNEILYSDFPLYKLKERDFRDSLWLDNSDIYCLFTVNLAMETDLMAKEIIREIKGNAPIIFFGPTPTYWPEKFLKDKYTYVVRGEPEYTLRELIIALSNKDDVSSLKGISLLGNGKVIHNPAREPVENLDELPFAARDLVDKQKNKYFYPKLRTRPMTLVLASRNCPYRCSYCVPCSLSFAIELEHKRYFHKKPPLRLRSVENILAELRLIKEQGYRAVEFLDDNFVWGQERTIQICQGIKDLDIVWGCQSRADLLNENIVREMAKANCRYIDIGVESFDQRILDYIKKDIKVEDSIKVIELVKSYGIDTKINIIFGASPLETKETIERTRKIIKDLGVDQVMYSVCAPWPGTETYEIAKKEGWFVYGDYKICDGDRDAIIQFPHLSKQDLEDALRWANREFFLKPRFIFKNLLRTGFFNFKNLKDSIKALLYKIR